MSLQFPESLGKIWCQVTDSRNQVTFFIYFQRFQSHIGRYWMPAVGITVAEHAVLKMRFGIDQQREYTLEEIGLNFDVTRERIRQIEVKAISRLRHPSRKLFISS